MGPRRTPSTLAAMLPDLEPVTHRAPEPISSEVTRRLLDYLISGQVQPGERLPSERQLAETLGVGRSHVRQAIKSLTVLGLVDARQGDGTYLKRTDSPLLPSPSNGACSSERSARRTWSRRAPSWRSCWRACPQSGGMRHRSKRCGGA